MKKIKFYLFNLISFLAVLEILLRLTGFFDTWNEKKFGTYHYMFGQTKDSWFHTWPPNETIAYGGDEFTYQNHYNDLGHRDIDFKDFKQDTSASKYVFLGDSFTEGDGAPWDSTWVKAFEKNIRLQLDSNVLAYNAGVCGSDIYFNYIMLKENLLESKPKVVFECVNNTDVSDVYYHGGLERFQEDGTMKSRDALLWEPLYKYSHVFRMFILIFTPYNSGLANEITLDREEQKIVEKMAEQIKLTHQLCAENNIEYYLVYMPVSYCEEQFEPSAFDSLPALLENKVPVLDIFPCMFTTLDCDNKYAYFWEKNGHYNGRGYGLMGDCIFEEYLKIKEE